MTSSRLSPTLRERVVAVVDSAGGRLGRRRVLAARRLAAALLVVVAAVLAVAPRPGAGTVAVVVTTADVAAGAPLADELVTVAHWPAALVPDGAATEVTQVVGRLLVGAARAGEPVTDLRMAGADATLTAGPGAAAVAIRPADHALIDVLRPGSRVDVVAAGSGRGPAADGVDGVGDGGAAQVLADGVSVLAVLPGQGGDRGVIMVAMPQELAASVAATTLTAEVAVTLR